MKIKKEIFKDLIKLIIFSEHPISDEDTEATGFKEIELCFFYQTLKKEWLELL